MLHKESNLKLNCEIARVLTATVDSFPQPQRIQGANDGGHKGLSRPLVIWYQALVRNNNWPSRLVRCCMDYLHTMYSSNSTCYSHMCVTVTDYWTSVSGETIINTTRGLATNQKPVTEQVNSWKWVEVAWKPIDLPETM